MLDYKEIIIRHYGGGMSGRALAEQGFGSKSGINGFLSAFEACERLSFPLPEGITNYGIAELVYGANDDPLFPNGCFLGILDVVDCHGSTSACAG